MPAREPPDPLDAVLRPPPDEPPAARAARLAREAEAVRVSNEIDEQIKRERVLRRKKQVVRLLLLGQSESGKSTTLRQFQRLYTPSAFRDERPLWRAVIQLNVVRSIRTILDALAAAFSSSSPSSSSSPHAHAHARALSTASRARSLSSASASDASDLESTQPGTSIRSRPRARDRDSDRDRAHLPAHLESLALRLLPLRHIEALLIARLVPPGEAEPTHFGLTGGGGWGGGWADAGGSVYSAEDAYGAGYASGLGGNGDARARHHEVFVRPGASWKAVPLPRSPTGHGEEEAEEEEDEGQAVLDACREDMCALWADAGVREVLRRGKVRVEEGPGFFLNDLQRIARRDYCPSDEDVFRARLKTVGVCEYTFAMEAGYESGAEWRIADVGGSRSQRPRWVPYFDDVDAIIFLAPISAFDQTLVEDKSVNRLEDSVYLWKAVCANALLAKVELILFMNKCDILDAKLRSGIRLAKYLRSFGDRPNDLEHAQKFFRGKFSFIHREHSPQPRKFHGYCTSVTDASTTSGILVSVRDMVMREHLRKAKLLP